MKQLLLLCALLIFLCRCYSQIDTTLVVLKVNSDAAFFSDETLQKAGMLTEGSYVFIIGRLNNQYQKLVRVVTDSAIGYTFPGVLGMSEDEFKSIDTARKKIKTEYAIMHRPELLKLQKIFNNDRTKKAEASAKKTVEFVKQIKQAGALVTLNKDIGEYSAGFVAKVLNPTNKTIKYVWITTKAINPVNDVVSSKTVRAVGPIEPMQSGVYEFENVYFSRVIKSIVLKKLLVEYMDGTKKIITGDLLFDY